MKQEDLFSLIAENEEPQVETILDKPTPKHQTEPKMFTVSELTRSIQDLLESRHSDVWITGEISGLKSSRGRHWYFGLKDEAAFLNAIIFNGEGRKFPFQLTDGLEVICHGRLNVYAPSGKYSFIIDHVEPKGIGALQLAFEQLKKKLFAEGLFDVAHKKPLPKLPNKIGVITSPTGAAVRDILNVLQRRFPGISVLVVPAKVQGEGAAEDIAHGIELLNRRDDIDLMIVGRGGGSIEDLWAFNEEIVAYAIFASKIPVVSAVGHEIDFTIADFVADLRAPTPSAAAELVVPKKEDLLAEIKEMKRQLWYALQNNFELRKLRLAELKKSLRDPRQRFVDLLIRIDDLRNRIVYAARNVTERCTQDLRRLMSNLDHLSPLNILAKGYAVVHKEKGKKAIQSAEELKKGDVIRIRLHAGEIGAKVTDRSP